MKALAMKAVTTGCENGLRDNHRGSSLGNRVINKDSLAASSYNAACSQFIQRGSSYNAACSQFIERALRAGCARMTQIESQHLSLFFVWLDLGTTMTHYDGVFIMSDGLKKRTLCTIRSE